MNDRRQWSSEWTFILAALGSAVGLGNIWRFPYVAGENGGGAFVLLYLFFVLGIGLPALIATIMIGRRGKLSPIRCFETVARQEGLSSNWMYLGWLLVLSAFLLLTFFSVVASWAFDYVVKSATGTFTGLDADSATALFDGAHVQCTAPCNLARTVHGSHAVRRRPWHTPGYRTGRQDHDAGLFVLLLVLACYALVVGDASRALSFLFTPRCEQDQWLCHAPRTGTGALEPQCRWCGHVGVWRLSRRRRVHSPRGGGDCGRRYPGGPYRGPGDIPPGIRLWPDARRGPGVDICHAAHCVRADAGRDALRRNVLRSLLLAALTTALSMFEPVVAWLEDSRGISRKWGALIAGFVAWSLGLATVFSFNIWADVRPLGVSTRFRT